MTSKTRSIPSKLVGWLWLPVVVIAFVWLSADSERQDEGPTSEEILERCERLHAEGSASALIWCRLAERDNPNDESLRFKTSVAILRNGMEIGAARVYARRLVQDSFRQRFEALAAHYERIEELPAFEEFPARDTVQTCSASDQDSRGVAEVVERYGNEYSDVLGEAASHRPNMGGRFLLISLGCGTACQNYVLIDCVTGSVKNLDVSSTMGAASRAGSNLVILDPPETILQEVVNGGFPIVEWARYFRLVDGELVAIDSVRVVPTD